MGENFWQDNECEQMLYPGKSSTYAGTSLETGVHLVCVGSINQDDNQSSRQASPCPTSIVEITDWGHLSWLTVPLECL